MTAGGWAAGTATLRKPRLSDNQKVRFLSEVLLM